MRYALLVLESSCPSHLMRELQHQLSVYEYDGFVLARSLYILYYFFWHALVHAAIQHAERCRLKQQREMKQALRTLQPHVLHLCTATATQNGVQMAFP